jgi:hypothetical protein
MAGYSYDRRGNRIRVEIASHTAGICHSDGRYSRGKITSRRTHLMPQFQMTLAEEQQYGNTLTIWQALRLLQTWSPLVNYAREFVSTVDPYKKSIVVANACEWLASKTDSALDDQLVRHVSDVLKTKEGEQLVRFCLLQAGVK